MTFELILWISALLIAGTAGYFSIIGLALTFAGSYWAVICMGVALEIGKLTAVSFLYRMWNQISFFIKGYLMSAILVLMLITSTGIFGFLSQGFSSSTLAFKNTESQLAMYTTELEERRMRNKQINKQIADAEGVDRKQEKLNMLWAHRKEHRQNLKRIEELSLAIPALHVESNNQSSHVGPIIYIAEVFKIPIAEAVMWVTLLIILVFDPLAVALTLAANIMHMQVKPVPDRRKVERETVDIEKVFEENRDRVGVAKAPTSEDVLSVDEAVAMGILKTPPNDTPEVPEPVIEPVVVEPEPVPVVSESKPVVEPIPKPTPVEEVVIPGYAVETPKELEDILDESEMRLLKGVRTTIKEGGSIEELAPAFAEEADSVVQRMAVLHNKLSKAGYSDNFIFRGE